MFTNRFDSFLKVSQFISACLFLLQIKYNENITKAICFLDPLVFGIYLIHYHPLNIKNFLPHIFDNAPIDIGLLSTLYLIVSKALKMFLLCIIIDYIRNKLFSCFRIKKFCIFTESKIKKLGIK